MVLEFKERAFKKDYQLTVYEALAGDALFAYLYVTPEDYSLVWMAPDNFSFTGKLPCEFIEYQFSNMSPAEIELSEDVIPIHRARKVEPRKPFSYSRSVLYLIFTDEGDGDEDGGEDEDYEKYNFFEERDQERYKGILGSDLVSNILLARYDFTIATYEIKTQEPPEETGRFDCCFTSENRRGASVNGWELAVNLPKNLKLDRHARVLKWIAKNHRDRAFWRSLRLDFDKSLNALYETLGG